MSCYEFSVPIDGDHAIHVKGIVVDLTEEQLKAYETQRKPEKTCPRKGFNTYKFPHSGKFPYKFCLAVFFDEQGFYTGRMGQTIVSTHSADEATCDVMLAEFMESTGATKANNIYSGLGRYGLLEQDGVELEIKRLLGEQK